MASFCGFKIRFSKNEQLINDEKINHLVSPVDGDSFSRASSTVSFADDETRILGNHNERTPILRHIRFVVGLNFNFILNCHCFSGGLIV